MGGRISIYLDKEQLQYLADLMALESKRYPSSPAAEALAAVNKGLKGIERMSKAFPMGG